MTFVQDFINAILQGQQTAIIAVFFIVLFVTLAYLMVSR